MINPKYVRENIDAIRASLAKRKSNYDLEGVLELDRKWRDVLADTQKLQAERNKASLQVSELKKKKEDSLAAQIIKNMSALKEKLDENQRAVEDYEKQIDKQLMSLPNILHESVPYGIDDTQNVVVRKFKEPKANANARGHEEIALKLDLIDIERAAKVSGARFYYLKGDLVILEQSLIRYSLDYLIQKGYTPIEPPFMMREEAYRGVTSLDDFENALYKVGGGDDNDNLRLIATSEHPMAAMHCKEIIDKAKLPLRYAGISPCFRMEAGTHGKDTKGIFRVHQFNKIEQFIFARQEDSWKLFDELIENSEHIFKSLDMPYRVVNICTGDIGIVAAKKYDIEVYLPSQDKYREAVSCSNCTDWQGIRLDIKYEEGGERKYVHTLNSTAVSLARAIVAIIENYANDDGTIRVPDVLVPYMNKRTIG